jgi:hypothetical protein
MMRAALFRDTFIFVGGEDNSGGSHKIVIEYDPKTEGWITWNGEMRGMSIGRDGKLNDKYII